MVDKFVGECFGLENVWTCQVRIEACPGERHAEWHRMIELASLSDRHQTEAPCLIRTATQPDQVRQDGEGIDLSIVAKPPDKRLSRRFIIAMQR